MYKDKLHMFYNGDGFGDTGIAYATMDLKWISTKVMQITKISNVKKPN